MEWWKDGRMGKKRVKVKAEKFLTST